MAKVSFNVDAYTARLIGRENVAKLDGAVFELVKNTYDADASVCFIYYDDEKEILYIGDNGTGMTPDTILKYWMTIGSSDKKVSFVSKKGRIQTGAKGIGRFALDRIADQCVMLTSTENSRVIWTVDWRDFEKEGNITEITADLEETSISFLDFLSDVFNAEFKEMVKTKFIDKGTIFKLSLLRDKWSTERLSSMKNELSTLIPPELSSIFSIYLFDNGTGIDVASVLINTDAFSFDYKVNFSVEQDGVAKIDIWRNEFDFGNKFDHIIINAGFTSEDRAYFTGAPIRLNTSFSELITKEQDKIKNTIGSFSGSLYFSKLQATADDMKRFYYKDIITRRNNLGAFGGIKIYRDQFRVRPYGGDSRTSNFDWLQLSSRKDRSPAGVANRTGAWRVRSDQILGSVHISRINTTLPDQANREGIVETPEFRLLREFLLSIIQMFERDRQYVCRKLDALYENESEVEKYQKEIKEKALMKPAQEEKAQDIKANSNVMNIASVDAGKAQMVIEAKEAAIRDLEDENRLLRILATTGIATNSYIHEFREQTHRLSMKIIMAKEALEFDYDQEEALRQLTTADQIRNSFTSWFRITVESVRRDKRSLKNIDLKAFIIRLCNAWEQVLSGKEIKISLDLPDEPVYYRCFPYEIDIILNNLITNSTAILGESKSNNKTIYITIRSKSNSVVLEYADNGHGLATAYIKNPELILEPFETSKMNEQGELIGTGMGMWLVKRTVSEYNGNIDLSLNTEESKGFICVINLPKKGMEGENV